MHTIWFHDLELPRMWALKSPELLGLEAHCLYLFSVKQLPLNNLSSYQWGSVLFCHIDIVCWGCDGRIGQVCLPWDVFAVFFLWDCTVPTFPSLSLPLVADSHMDNVAGSPRTLWTVIFKTFWISQSPTSPACKELQIFELYGLGNFPQAVRQSLQFPTPVPFNFSAHFESSLSVARCLRLPDLIWRPSQDNALP
jgi:hypothetical protein